MLIPYIERKEHSSQRNEVLAEALRQKLTIQKGASEQLTERLSILSEELETNINKQKEDLENELIELTERESLLTLEEQRVNRIEELQIQHEEQLEQSMLQVKDRDLDVQKTRIQLISSLENISQSQASNLKKTLSNDLVNEKQLELQKVTKFLQEEFNSSAARLARRLLDRVHSRYAPKFVWPKPSNILEVKDKNLHSYFLLEHCPLINELQELSGVKIIPFQPSDGFLFIKVAGGFGISREAVRLTLEKIVTLEKSQWPKAKSLFSAQSTRLDGEAARLGKKATDLLSIKGIHPELQKLVGALNWRTSYRQNQWYHTIEVAQFANILATELGVNADDAKRVGLLHDIGKAIDYRIDGSHAVISGDYADRCGEKRYICDTVMSHHSDIIIETPLAYILQAADTLSGARPGARVNLEEGYQVRLTAIHDVVKSFPGIQDLAVMNGGREVHIQVHSELISESDVKPLTEAIARKIEKEVAYPGQIKILVTRTYESYAVA